MGVKKPEHADLPPLGWWGRRRLRKLIQQWKDDWKWFKEHE